MYSIITFERSIEVYFHKQNCASCRNRVPALWVSTAIASSKLTDISENVASSRSLKIQTGFPGLISINFK